MSPVPTLKQLSYLAALAETGSFSAAAAQCCVTQSTLSAGIAAMEEVLGQKIIDRSARILKLTPLGLATLEDGRRMLAMARQIAERAQASCRMPLAGSFRFGVIPTIAPYLLPRFLPEVQARFPDLDLHLEEDLTDRLLARIDEGGLDCALLAFPYETPGLEQHVLFTESFFAALPPETLCADTPMTLEELGAQNLLLLEDGHCLRTHALEACKLASEKASGNFRAASLPTLIALVRDRYGMTLLPEMALDDARRAGLCIRPLEAPVPSRQVGLVWRRNHYNRAAFICFGDVISRY